MASSQNGPWRSFLFAPANHARRAEKAFQAGADAAILDLEDAVAVAERPAARAGAVVALERPRLCKGFVRVNAAETEWCFGDMEAVVGPWLDGIVLPKLESAATLQTIDWTLTQLERKAGLEIGSIDLMPLIETGRGVSNLKDIVSCRSRLRRLCFGAGDYTLDVGMRWSLDEVDLSHARAALVVESRAGGLEPPIDTVFIELRETGAFAASACRARGLGFQGKLCIHPSQVGPVNDAFSPTEQEMEHARRIVMAFEVAEAAGSASIQVDGYFVDYPIVEKARRTLALADRIRRARARREASNDVETAGQPTDKGWQRGG